MATGRPVRAVQELEQLVAGISMLREIAIDRVKQDHVQAVGLEFWRVCHH